MENRPADLHRFLLKFQAVCICIRINTNVDQKAGAKYAYNIHVNSHVMYRLVAKVDGAAGKGTIELLPIERVRMIVG